jgi:hypothetical protein
LPENVALGFCGTGRTAARSRGILNDGERTVLVVKSAEGQAVDVQGRIKIMRKMPKRQVSSKSAPGPQPDFLKIEGGWQEAVRTSFGKKTPVGGWPKKCDKCPAHGV